MSIPELPDDRANVPAEVLTLSARQREICALLIQGCQSKQIAHRLTIGRRTVEKERHDAARALCIDTHLLVVWAAENRRWLPDASQAIAKAA